MMQRSKNNGQIDTKSIVDQVIDRIVENIISGVYIPGEKLPNEYELMDSMGISRNSIREAIKILVAMGILEIKRGDGTYVCSQLSPTIFDNVVYSMISSMSTVQEMLEVRQVLDEATVRMASIKASDTEIDAMQENIINMTEAFTSGNFTLARDLDFDYHMMMIDSCKNTFFSRLVKGVYGIFNQSIGETVSSENQESKACVYHQQMLDCVKNKDFPSISSVVEASLTTWRNRIKTIAKD